MLDLCLSDHCENVTHHHLFLLAAAHWREGGRLLCLHWIQLNDFLLLLSTFFWKPREFSAVICVAFWHWCLVTGWPSSLQIIRKFRKSLSLCVVFRQWSIWTFHGQIFPAFWERGSIFHIRPNSVVSGFWNRETSSVHGGTSEVFSRVFTPRLVGSHKIFWASLVFSS